jgi:hypothetical protein
LERVTYQRFAGRVGKGRKWTNLIASFHFFLHSLVRMLGSAIKVSGQERLRLLYIII